MFCALGPISQSVNNIVSVLENVCSFDSRISLFNCSVNGKQTDEVLLYVYTNFIPQNMIF